MSQNTKSIGSSIKADVTSFVCPIFNPVISNVNQSNSKPNITIVTIFAVLTVLLLSNTFILPIILFVSMNFR